MLGSQQLHADPLADNTMGEILGAWSPLAVSPESDNIAAKTSAWISALNPHWKN